MDLGDLESFNSHFSYRSDDPFIVLQGWMSRVGLVSWEWPICGRLLMVLGVSRDNKWLLGKRVWKCIKK